MTEWERMFYSLAITFWRREGGDGWNFQRLFWPLERACTALCSGSNTVHFALLWVRAGRRGRVRRAERRIASAVLTLVNAALLLGAVIPAVSARSWPAVGDSDVQLLLGAPALVASAAMSVLVLRGMWRA